MSQSAHGSKTGAWLTLVVVAAVIGVVLFYAIKWTGNLAEQSAETGQTATPASQSPDLQNISDQFDEL